MPRRSRNKSAAIREMLDAMPDAKPKAIVAALAEKRVRVTAGQVSNVKHYVKANGKSHRNGKLSIEALLEAKKLADRIGLRQAQEALDVLAKLQ